MALDLAQVRCFNHANREAVARCLTCERFFCRECMTEHDGRVICAGCLSELFGEHRQDRLSVARAMAVTGAVTLAFVFVWGVFFTVGQLLLLIPSSFHEGTLWRWAWTQL